MKRTLSRGRIIGALLMFAASFGQLSLAQEDVTDLEGTNWQLLNMKVLGGYLFTPEDPSQYRLNFRSDNNRHFGLQHHHGLLFPGEHRVSLRSLRVYTKALLARLTP